MKKSPCVRARVRACGHGYVRPASRSVRLRGLPSQLCRLHPCIWWRHVLPCTCAYARLTVIARAVRVEENDYCCCRFKFAGWFTRLYFLFRSAALTCVFFLTISSEGAWPPPTEPSCLLPHILESTIIGVFVPTWPFRGRA